MDSGDTKDVRIIAKLQEPSIFDRLWQPSIAEWDRRHLIVAYGVHLHGKVDMGDIVAAISTDDGETWSSPVRIFDHSLPQGGRRLAYANPVLYKPPGQRVVWCFAMRCPLHYRDSEESELCAAYSSDGGWSWIQAELAVDHHSPVITVAGIHQWKKDDEIRYLLPVHRNTLRHDPGGQMDHMVLESTSLLEWKLAGYIPQPESGPVFLHEGNIAPGDSEDEIKIVMRTGTYGRKVEALDPPIAFSSVSRDGGRTWSTAVPEPDLHNSVSKAYFGRSRSGTHIYVYSTGPKGERRKLAYKLKPPGSSWSEERVFFDIGVKNSYPTLLEKTDGHFYAVWDSSDSANRPRTMIRFGRLSF
jgi:hypothetical protein